ncbi:MAG: PDZ domain-containing protein [Bacillota bacterium]|nr:PDZ domain-containing protein [Bacillota bacterium]
MEVLLEISRVFMLTYALAFVMPIFWIVLFLVYLQYRRQLLTEKKLFGRAINNLGKQMLTSVGLGAVGGIAASIVLVFLGLSLEQIGLYFIWPVALLLLLLNPRYLCFSYAGGIVALLVLFTRYILTDLFPGLSENLMVEALLKIHIPALLVLIGLLHLIEAFLIYFGAHQGSSPVYLKQESGGVIGAYLLQRFWPIPLVGLLVSVVLQSEIVGVSMPDWWPILQSTIQPGEGQSLQYMVIPVAAGLGYADIAISSSPRERSRFSAKWLAAYSIVLLIIAIASEYYPSLIIIGVILAPVGHEILIIYGKKREEKRPSYYQFTPHGVQLMTVLPGSSAMEAGLQEGDKITGINNMEVNSTRELMTKIDESYFMVFVEGIRDGSHFSVILKKEAGTRTDTGRIYNDQMRPASSSLLLHRCVELGVIPVPEPDSPVYLEARKPDTLGWIRKIKKRIKVMLRIS